MCCTGSSRPFPRRIAAWLDEVLSGTASAPLVLDRDEIVDLPDWAVGHSAVSLESDAAPAAPGGQHG